MNDLPLLQLRVADVEQLTPSIKGFRLVCSHGGPLPGYAAGAHVSIQIPINGVPQWRSYSLINTTASLDTNAPQTEYRIAVRLDASGQGGSSHIHRELCVGSELTARPPGNFFTLDPVDDAVLIAGGIGVTPIVSMAAALTAQAKRYQLHYAARNTQELAYSHDLTQLNEESVHLYTDESKEASLSVERLLGNLHTSQPLYVCGPKGMIDTILELATANGWDRSNVHFELFNTDVVNDGDETFELELALSNQVVQVGPGQSILDALLACDLDVMHDCRAGFCGLCSVPVISGEIDHRDTYLSDKEKASGKVMQACVSRSGCGRLVLNL